VEEHFDDCSGREPLLLCEPHGVDANHRVVTSGTDKGIERTDQAVRAFDDGGDFRQLLRE
jgi:hypothetical protein